MRMPAAPDHGRLQRQMLTEWAADPGEGGTCAARLGCDVQEGGRRRHARGRRRRARVRQRGVRQGARAAAAAVLQVQGRGLLLQGVPGGRPGRPATHSAPYASARSPAPAPFPPACTPPPPDCRVEGRRPVRAFVQARKSASAELGHRRPWPDAPHRARPRVGGGHRLGICNYARLIDPIFRGAGGVD